MIRSWLRTHRKRVVVHSLILGGFLLYMVFLAGPLFDRLEAVPGEANQLWLSLPDETGDIRYFVDVFNVDTRRLEVMGWAFIYGYSSDNNSVYMVLKSRSNTYVFGASSQWRPDVTAAYKELGLNLGWSGFYCLIPLRQLAPGEYTLGLYITQGEIQGLQYTDKKFVR